MVHQWTANTLPISNPPGTNKYVVDPVSASEKFIKHDPKDFPVISDIKDWNKFCQGMQATAKVQGVEPPFDPTYIPSTADQASFDQQNGYDYKILMYVVKDLCSRQS
jgi:hypothetical protein